MEGEKMTDKKENNCFAVIVGDIVIGINLPFKKAQKMSKRAIKKFGLNMVVIANQNFIDIEELISV